MYDKIRRNKRISISPSERTCHLKRQSEYKEYGFYLFQENTVSHQVVGIVDEGSSADKAGLKVGDRILEVNDEDVRNKTHSEVVKMMKTKPLEMKLVVVNQEAEEYYNEKRQHKAEEYNRSRISSTSSCEDLLFNDKN